MIKGILIIGSSLTILTVLLAGVIPPGISDYIFAQKVTIVAIAALYLGLIIKPKHKRS